MQGDNGVRSTGTNIDRGAWASVFTGELLKMIKSSYRTQVAFVEHLGQASRDDPGAAKHGRYPRLTKQQLSKRLKKTVPDWPLATMIIKCCTHNDHSAAAGELARMAGIYEAATGAAPKGYAGPRITPEPPASARTAELDPGVVPHLRGRLADTQAQLTACRKDLDTRDQQLHAYRERLSLRDSEIEVITAETRKTSSSLVAVQLRNGQYAAQIERLRVELSEVTARYQDQAARAHALTSRYRALWERYALLNISRETGPGHPVLAAGALAIYPPHLALPVDPDAPAPRRALAIYLNTYRELVELSLPAIASACGLDVQHAEDILAARTAPSLDTAMTIAVAVTAPAPTVARLHATMRDDESWNERPVASSPVSEFDQIVASMTEQETVADTGDRRFPPALLTMAETKLTRRVAPVSVAVPEQATVAGDGHRDRLDTGDGQPTRIRWSHVAGNTMIAVAIWAGILWGLYSAPIEPMSPSSMLVLAGMLTLIGTGPAWGVPGNSLLAPFLLLMKVIGRRFYRGRHVRPGGNQERPGLDTYRAAMAVPYSDLAPSGFSIENDACRRARRETFDRLTFRAPVTAPAPAYWSEPDQSDGPWSMLGSGWSR
ncbi:hypothetical protein [Actinoplanes siamensis]|uniref:Uncharacterized protein n=1 Tax=Actinoplanes siamensis TaxID=1223317 RepID=A0A919TNP6_9ACTN|nr:hypothetical protein [Actinoplanes siamensis]GIF08994.1 hypothetical protein Asi03nite_65320 [Actinoplanes siamensis]